MIQVNSETTLAKRMEPCEGLPCCDGKLRKGDLQDKALSSETRLAVAIARRKTVFLVVQMAVFVEPITLS